MGYRPDLDNPFRLPWNQQGSIDRKVLRDLAAGRRIDSPTLVLTGDFYLTRAAQQPPVEVWRNTFAPQAQGVVIDSGHFLAEENPQATIDALMEFL